ncbi:hypothetical protein [Planktothrix serta]|uniref:hypothetical protein n=1 Tax=Planktothrix serta TaxID=1678310 RepID=UPI0012DEF8CF|nr:hypothetical protein [Planktothrix serta]
MYKDPILEQIHKYREEGDRTKRLFSRFWAIAFIFPKNAIAFLSPSKNTSSNSQILQH